MKWEDLLSIVGGEPVFRTGFLTWGKETLAEVRMQLSRWVKAGRLIKLKKGLYTLAQPYRKVTPHPFLIANAMKKASYVSMQSAMGHYGMIPEYVPAVTSITTQRPEEVKTSFGRFVFRHVRKSWFHGYRQIDVGSGQRAFIAIPEKALLDLIYLTPGADNYDFLNELRLQNLEQLNTDTIRNLADESGSVKLLRAAKLIAKLVRQEAGKEL
jgi:predicted transcriptional regulator of viral defense system